MKRVLAFLAALSVAAMPVIAQFNLPGIPQPVYDALNHIQLAAQAASMATQVGISSRISTTLNKIEQWGSQITLAKIPWVTHLPSNPQTTRPHDTWGEMATWGTTLATGQLAAPSWQAARAQLGNLAVLIEQRQRQMQSQGNPGGTPPFISQLATVEALDAAGTNNLSVIGQARNYLATDLPAMKGLQDHVMSPRSEDNGPTQQMQYVAAAQTQNTSTAVHSLQVNTGILETVTVLAKGLGDASTADLNLQIKQQQTFASQPTGIKGMGSAFTNHP